MTPPVRYPPGYRWRYTHPPPTPQRDPDIAAAERAWRIQRAYDAIAAREADRQSDAEATE